MSQKRIQLPPNSWRKQEKGYEEVHIPGVKQPFGDDEKLVPIDELPEWARKGFTGYKSLNRIQSRLWETALLTSENMLLCAPTGAGKTNVAMLTMLHEIGLHLQPDGKVDKTAFKIVYVAPMKALVQEQVQQFGQRLKEYDITVRELSGDNNLTK